MATNGKEAGESIPRPEIFRPTTLEIPGAFAKLAEYWVVEYGGEGVRFSKEQEALLAELVAAGQRAEAELSGAGGTEQEVALTEVIQEGRRAQQAFVETNLAFAFHLASISVGKLTKGQLERFRGAGAAWRQAHAGQPGVHIARYADDKRGHMGAHRPLSSLRSPYADLEGRQQMAAIGMMSAATKFRGIYTDSDGKVAEGSKFITYAAHDMQQKIERNIPYEEHPIRLPYHKGDEVLQYFRLHPTEEIDEPMPAEITRLIKLNDAEVFPDDLTARHEGGVVELSDPWGEDDRAETFADIYADPNQNPEETAVQAELSIQLAAVLDSLSEREAGVIRMRYGIGCSPMPLDEIGNEFGVTKERIRQIESKTMAMLRHPSRSEHLRDFLDFDDKPGGVWNDSVSRGDQIKIPEGDASFFNGPRLYGERPISQVMSMTPEQWRDREERLAWRKERWQVHLDEPFDAPVRTEVAPQKPLEFINDPTLFAFIYKVIDSADSYHFQKSYGESIGVPYPIGLINRIEAYADGKNLTHGHIVSIWDRFMRSGYQRLKKELGDDFSPDRVGQFFSKLIDNNIGSIESHSTLLTLKIPSAESGKIGYLASNLRSGHIKIIGNPGNFVANNNGGFAEIEVVGNVGDSAGAGMHGNAHLLVKGYGGSTIGLGARGDAFIEIDSCRSIGISGDEEIHVSTKHSS